MPPSSRPLSPQPPAAPLTRSLCSSTKVSHPLTQSSLPIFVFYAHHKPSGWKPYIFIFSWSLWLKTRPFQPGPALQWPTPPAAGSAGNIFRPFQVAGRIPFLVGRGWVPLSCKLLAGDHVAPRGHPRSLPCDPSCGSLTLPIFLHLCLTSESAQGALRLGQAHPWSESGKDVSAGGRSVGEHLTALPPASDGHRNPRKVYFHSPDR